MNPSFTRTTRAIGSDRGPARAVLVAGLVALVGWVGWFALGGVTLYESSEQAVIQAHGTVRLHASVTGRLAAVDVALGQDVQAGDVLVRFEDTEARLAVEAARAEVRGLEEQLSRVASAETSEEAGREAGDRVRRAELSRARSDRLEVSVRLQDARAELLELENLAARGAAAATEVRSAGMEVRALEARLQAASSEVARLTGLLDQGSFTGEAEADRGAENQATLEAALAVARSELARTEEVLRGHHLVTPVAGRIGELSWLAPGERVESGALIAVVVPDAEPEIVAQFPAESAVGRIQPGQSATVRIPGAVGGALGAREARVDRVGSEPREDGLVTVVLALQEEAAEVRHGLPAEVEVAVERVRPMELVLRSAAPR